VAGGTRNSGGARPCASGAARWHGLHCAHLLGETLVHERRIFHSRLLCPAHSVAPAGTGCRVAGQQAASPPARLPRARLRAPLLRAQPVRARERNAAARMSMTSHRPYLVRALHEWILENDCTPYILVNAFEKGVEVPQNYVKDGQIVLNISPIAVQ